MKPLDQIPDFLCRSLRGIFSDIDDTITTNGMLSAEAYSAIENISKRGIEFIPITGRPAGWCDMIARFWPVRGVIGENGAFFFSYDHKKKKMIRRYIQNEKDRLEGLRKLEKIKQKVLEEVMGCAVSSDQFSRISDLAIDFSEDVPELPIEAVKKIKEIFVQSGATAKISSIHVNAWFGKYNKLEMTRIFTKEILDIDLDRNKNDFVFCGDSPNDEPLFKYFPNSFGVANVKDFKSEMTYLPTYVSSSKGGKGFVEICKKFLDFD
ncbi:HAD-IIB family hydrolase [Paracoccaceae bacterium]|nr:HAD-IIB family hydrolase [Paracoccaceae bacterium]